MKRLLSLCEHPYEGVRGCTCGKKAVTQMRLYIRPGENRVGSLSFSRYYCLSCLRDFRKLMIIPGTDVKDNWNVKIDLAWFTLEKKVDLEYKIDGVQKASKTGISKTA